MGNQLIIIGNGFDMECGLESGFNDFFTDRFGDEETGQPTPDDMNLWDCFFQFMKEVQDDMPYEWKDVESAIKDWVTVIFDAADDNQEKYGNASPFVSAQWAIGRVLTNRQAVSSLIGEAFRVQGMQSSFSVGRQSVPGFPSSLISEPEGQIVSRAIENQGYALRDTLLKIKKYEIQPKGTATIDNVLFDELQKFEENFKNYMTKIIHNNVNYRSNACKLYDCISREAMRSSVGVDNNYVLSFNYTRPDVMGSDNAPRCWRNVHGNLDDGNIIFGFDIADLADEQRKDPRFLRFAKTYRVFQLQKTTEDGQSGLLEPVAKGETFDTIKVYGHSLNRADYSYFKAIFDCVDLYSSNVTLRLLYPSDHPEVGTGLYENVSNLLTNYGIEMPDKGKGRNLMHKLLLEDRLSVTGIDTSSLAKKQRDDE